MVCIKIGEQTKALVLGAQQSLPDPGSFYPGWGNYFQLNNGFQPPYITINDLFGSYIDPNFDLKYYGISDSGFLQLTASGAQAGMQFLGQQIGGDFVYYNGTLRGVINCIDGFLGTNSNANIYIGEINADINDGVIGGVLTTLAFDTMNYNKPLNATTNVGYQLNTNGPLGIISPYFFTPNSSSFETGFFYLNGGSIGQLQISNRVLNVVFTGSEPTFYNGRYITLSGKDIIDWLPTNLGDPDDLNITPLVFSEAAENDNIFSAITYYNGYFYVAFVSDGLNPIAPYICKIRDDFSEYEKIIIVPSDFQATQFFNGIVNNTAFATYHFSVIDEEIFVGQSLADEFASPIYYLLGDVTPLQQQLHPFALSCQNYCLPLFNTRKDN